MQKITFYIVAILLALLPFHAFLWTWFHSFFWQQDWTIVIQAWKEILVGLLTGLATWEIIKNPQRLKELIGRPNIFATALIFLAGFYLIFGPGELNQKIFGFRTITVFLVLFLVIQIFQFTKKQYETLVKIVLGAGSLVITFALIQKMLLPADFLKYFGYSENISSWLPGGNLPMYHLVGGTDIIRAQATLAGPNQLGAYLLIIIPLAANFYWRVQQAALRWLGFFGVAGGFIILILTYSRSAWLGAAVLLAAWLINVIWQRYRERGLAVLLGGGLVMVIIGGFLIYQSESARAILLRQASSSEHFTRSLVAVRLVARYPLGIGLGQTAGGSQRFGSLSSLRNRDEGRDLSDELNKNNLTPENTYLGVMLELGWLGGVLFLGLLVCLTYKLRGDESPLFYSLLGVMTVALFLHPLEDTTTALTLFLLAGIALTKFEKKQVKI